MNPVFKATHVARASAAPVRYNPHLLKLARVGIAVKGVVYLLVGILAVRAGMQNTGEATDTKGVIERVASHSFGEFALPVIALGLAGYALWRLMCAVMDSDHAGSDARGIGKRIYYGASAFLYATSALFAFKLMSGSASGGDKTQTLSAQLMDSTWGTILLLGLAAFIIVGAISQIRDGWHEKFREHLEAGSMSGEARNWAVTFGKWGYIARGAVFLIIGAFMVTATLNHNPGEVRGFEGALDAIAARPFGSWLLALTGLGLACYGLYALVESHYRRVSL